MFSLSRCNLDQLRFDSSNGQSYSFNRIFKAVGKCNSYVSNYACNWANTIWLEIRCHALGHLKCWIVLHLKVDYFSLGSSASLT